MRARDGAGKSLEVTFTDADPFPLGFDSTADAFEYAKRRGWTTSEWGVLGGRGVGFWPLRDVGQDTP